MYTMVMMMAMSGSTDTANFGGKLFGRGNSCHGNSCQGAMVVSAGCSGSYAAPTVPAPAYTGCSGTSCHGSMSCHGGNGGGGFLGLRGRMGNRSGCHGSTSCSGYIVPSTGCHGYHAPAADCCGTTAAYSTGCVGSIITGSTPGAVITETPATGAKEMPKVKDAPKGGTVPPTTTKSRDGV